MIQRKVTIKNKFGLHARPASQFVEIADRFVSDIYIMKIDQRANGRSILDLMSIAAGAGEIIIVADGEDEKEAIESLINGLDEFDCTE